MLCSAADEARKFRQEELKKQKSLGVGDDGCPEANGWSLPAKFADGRVTGTQHTAIPIPIYCRPVTDDPSVQVSLTNNNKSHLFVSVACIARLH